MLIFEYTKSGRTELTAKEIKDIVLSRDKEANEKKVPKNAFVPYFERFIQRYKGRTYDLYKCTLKKVITYVGMQKVESLDLTLFIGIFASSHWPGHGGSSVR